MYVLVFVLLSALRYTNRMKLVMTGGGDSKHFREIDKFFVNKLGKNPSLFFIPLAGKKRSWKNALTRIQETFSTIEFDNIEACEDLHSLTWEKLKSFDAIYIDGGNTFQLMDMIRDTHFYELLHRFLNCGGVVNGDSAGAIVLGSHIETAHFGLHGDENKAGVISYQGLNLIGNWAVHCHYKKREDKEILKFVLEYGFPVIALHETSSVFVNNRTLKVLGKRPIAIFTKKGKKIVEVGESFRL